MANDRETIYFVAGESSGDNHGAALMRALRENAPQLRFMGRGGPQMKGAAGASFHDWIHQAAVVGLWDVLRHYGFFRRQFAQTLEEIELEKPAAVVLIDYPGFNLRLAHALHARHQTKVIYYISPQVWAWNRGRIKSMARELDLMLCIFPFEADLYNRSGLRTIFVGHPMIERFGPVKTGAARDPQLVALFPGSRRREVRKNFPAMLETARELLRTNPSLKFEVGAASERMAQGIEKLRQAAIDIRDKIVVRTGDSASLMQRAVAGMVASGSATLEAAFFRLPFILIYKVPWVSYVTARMVVRVDYLGMPNLLAGRAIVPEFIQHTAQPAAMAAALRELIEQPSRRAEMVGHFDEIIASLGEGGASKRAADAIVAEIRQS